MNDRIYIFDKKPPYNKIYLGEIQTDFNISLVIDGTKDTTKMIVMSFTENQEIEADTIVYHENSNTWWIVSNDKVDKYLNESNSLYVHELSLDGAVELLNVRDLTDCGFNQNRYRIGDDINSANGVSFIRRLFNLSNFEFDIAISNQSKNNIDLSKVVDYVKTYENYTLLSALRDFLDGYNCAAKLEFAMDNEETKIDHAILHIVSKTGGKSNVNDPENYFNDVKEIQSMNKNSFGTTVVSNAQNVISTNEKTFPLLGAAKLSSTAYNITRTNAILRLPSNVFKANWIKCCYKVHCVAYIGPITTIGGRIDVGNEWSINDYIERIRTAIQNNIDLDSDYELILQDFDRSIDYIKENIIKAGTVTIFEGNVIDPTADNGNGKIIKGPNVPYLTKVYKGLYEIPTETINLILCDKETRDMLPKPYCGIYWERGKNYISGFDFLDEYSMSFGLKYTDLQQEEFIWSSIHGTSSVSFHIETESNNETNVLTIRDCSFIVNYIPMSDIKIKVDNQRDKNDIQLYNQNGKLTDSRALSKILNSYSKEISSDTITKYYTCYDFDDIKPVGSRFLIDNEIYVVNNLSLNCSQNENGYLIECEYTMSKQFAVKSMMVNPNTNIRDYGIPQNFNVERKQVYRDYIEFTYVADPTADNSPWISDYNEIINFTNYPKSFLDYDGVIKCTYKQAIGGNEDEGIPASDTWYYQLDTVKYELDKMIYIVMTFNDNNIIGYGSQNVYSGFVPSRLLTNWIDTINTPISYVDDDGEVLSIDIEFLDNNSLTEIYEDYIDYEEITTDKSVYNLSVFVPEYIYNHAYIDSKLTISEPTYKKDALEVPVFEYACQIGDSEDVLIGDNILVQDDEDYIYLYNWRTEQPYHATPENAEVLNEPTLHNGVWTIFNSVLGQIIGTQLRLNLYATTTIDSSTWEIINSGVSVPTADKDVVIFRHKIKKSTNELVASEPFMILRNIPATAITGYMGSVYIILQINQYKLR